MAQIEKCERCGIQNSFTVNITAICKKCGKEFLICQSCKPSWKINKCPSCNEWISSGTWNFIEKKGEGSITNDMLSYLDSYDNKAYIKIWSARKEQRDAERIKDGDSAHRGVTLSAEEVGFIRQLENQIREPIFTIADDRSNYIVIEDGHVTKLRLFNADVRKFLPNTISNLKKLQEFRFEKLDKNKGSLYKLPENIAECESLETVVLRSASEGTVTNILGKIKNLKKLSVQNTVSESGDPLKVVLNLNSLTELNMRSCWLNDDIMAECMGNMVELRKLCLAWVKQVNILPESLKNCIKLEEIDVTGANYGMHLNPWPKWLVELSNLNLIHRGYFQFDGWEFIEAQLKERNPEAYTYIPPDASENLTSNEKQSHWENGRSEILKIGWTGIE